MNRLSLLFFVLCLAVARAEDAKPVADSADFGSDDPIERPDLPSRGVIAFTMKTGKTMTMDHWEQFDWTFQAKRTGHYQVRLKYALTQSSLGVQFKHGETRLRKVLTAAPTGRTTYLGELYIAAPGDQGFAVYAPTAANAAGFEILEIALIPSNEGEPKITPAADGSITLLAKDATTWSDTMRYEAKPEKNCLGYWTDPDDFAEWEFEVKKPGRYQVIVTQGCGAGNGGSEVAVKLGSSEAKFKVQDSGGFQNWKDVPVGELEVKAPGTQRLVIDPVNKVKAAVLDVQKVVLKPVG